MSGMKIFLLFALGVIVLNFVLPGGPKPTASTNPPSMASAPVAPARTTDVIDDTFSLCNALQGTGLVTTCAVSGWNNTVAVRIDTTGSEARTMCAGITQLMAAKTTNFRGKQWALHILSPYSGTQPIAVCALY